MALKLRDNFSNLVAMLQKCLSLANRFSTKWRNLYNDESNSGFGLLLLERYGIIGTIPAALALSRISSES